MKELLIVSETATGKGRSFRAALLAYATCSAFMTGGDVRPIWAMIACSEAESIPFIRNLQSGRKAKIFGERSEPTIDFLKSADYAYAPQRHPEGTVWTVYLPSVYRIDAGMVDPDGVKFAVLPRSEWLPAADDRTAEALAKRYATDRGQWHREDKWTREEDAKRMATARHITRVAPLFCAYLDRRTRCPLIPDPLFYALVLGAMMDKGLATLAHSDGYGNKEWGRQGPAYYEHDVESAGLMPGIVCRAAHAQLEPVLAECVREYERERGGRSVAMAA